MITRGRAGDSRKGSGANRRRVNWFVPNGGVTRSVDGLNASAWAVKHRSALSGYFPCCGCWEALPNGTFTSNGGRCGSWAAERALGLEIVPTGGFSVAWILSEAWTRPGALASAVALVEREGWSGIGVDNENYSAQKDWDPRLPARFASLLGNLSAALDAAGKQLVVDICSTWNGCICGPQYLAEYARRAPAARFMDMADYDAKGNIPGGDKQQVVDLKKLMPLRQIAAGVGLVDAPGHRNASCGGWPQCTNISNPACGCLWYGWTAKTLDAFVGAAEQAGVEEIDVWREDMTPPPGTTADIPTWFIDTMTGFLQGGGDGEEPEETKPPFSWDTVPLFVETCNLNGSFSDADIEYLARFPMITVEKGMGVNTHVGYAEDRMYAAATRLRKAAPESYIVFYYNLVLDWTFFHASTIFAEHPKWSLKDDDGNVIYIGGDRHFPDHKKIAVFDHAQPAVQEFWASVCVNQTLRGGGTVYDGCYADRSCGENFTRMGFKFSPARQAAWDNGLRTTQVKTQARLSAQKHPHGAKSLVSNCGCKAHQSGSARPNCLPCPAAPDTHIVFVENFLKSCVDLKAKKSNASSCRDDVATVAAHLAAGKIVQVHAYRTSMPNASDITLPLAAFLLAAEEGAYFGFSNSWTFANDWSIWWPEYSKPLGPPVGPMHDDGTWMRRDFAHAKVALNPGTLEASIEWLGDEEEAEAKTWHLQSVRALDAPAGRYTQLRVAGDGNATLVWNGNAPHAGLRLTRCLDPACRVFAQPVTLAHADPNPRFVRMQMGARSLPRIVFAGANDTKLFLLRCEDARCGGGAPSDAKAVELAAADRVRYFDLLVDDDDDEGEGCGANAFAVALSFEKGGSGVGEGSWLNVIYGYPGDPGCPGGEVCEIAHSPHPFTIDSHTNLPSHGLDNPVLARTKGNGLTLAYWDIDAHALRLVFTPPGVLCGNSAAARTTVMVASNATGFVNPGAWTRMIAVDGGAGLVVAFFDLPAGVLYVAACDAGRHTCEAPRAVDTGVGHRDFTDYGAGAFPDMQLAPDGNPVLVYFSEKGGDEHDGSAGQLKAMLCADPKCAAFHVTVLASGLPGYGRDCSVAFANDGNMLVSFLDLQGKDAPNAMVARLAVLEAQR